VKTLDCFSQREKKRERDEKYGIITTPGIKERKDMKSLKFMYL
jgi:hypothetical protein